MFRISTLSFFLLTIGFYFFGLNSAFAQQANFEQAQRFTSDRMDKKSSSNGLYPRWIEEQNRFWYSYETAEGQRWYFVDAEEPSKRELFDRKVMASNFLIFSTGRSTTKISI